MTQPILITGATGNVGREIVKILFKQGAPVHAAIVSEAEAHRLPVPAPWVILDFTNPATYEAALTGVGKLFLMRPPHITNIKRDMKPLMDYAAQVGVEQIVFLSLLGAEKNKVVPHAKVEALLLAGPTPYTLLRCGFFMQNLSTTHRQEIRDHDEIFIPAGDGKTAFIDVRDIAAVAAKTLTEPGHARQAYTLTGAEALAYDQVAEMMSDVLRRPIRYRRPSLAQFAWRFWRQGHSVSYVAVVSAIYTTTRLGMAERVTNEVADLLGRPPGSMYQFIVDEATVWQWGETAVAAAAE
jgi:uncharacterized protein YbjT (DUF2867 family)